MIRRIHTYFINRRTKHANYKVIKHKENNGQKYYTVEFKSWLLGWHTSQEQYDAVTSMDKKFETKEKAFLFIEAHINQAYKILKTR